MTSLHLNSDTGRTEVRGRERDRGTSPTAIIVLLLVALAFLGFTAHQSQQRVDALERQVAELSAKSAQALLMAREASDQGAAAETAARAAAFGRQLADAQAGVARQEADVAQKEADTARETAAVAQAEADRIRAKAEADVNRLEEALGKIAETRRTALGLVMNLGSDHLKFEFDKAELRPGDKELLSRIAGIMVTAHDYTISVNGHTDDVGSDGYNKTLSERRAQAVRDYLAKAGLSEEILSVEGHGKSLPLVRGTTDAARAKNRRVELGIVNTQIRYPRP